MCEKALKIKKKRSHALSQRLYKAKLKIKSLNDLIGSLKQKFKIADDAQAALEVINN